MEHSKKFEKVRAYYNTFYNGRRLWTKDMVKCAVKKGWITEAEYEEIVGEEYAE